jgi:TIR domain
MTKPFDVFLSYNRLDHHTVEMIGDWLRSQGLRVWLDRWELRPGLPWQEGLEAAVAASGAVAVFVGETGLGAWQEPEVRAFIARSRTEEVAVIPVLLPGCPDSSQLALFLQAFTWVDLRDGVTDQGLSRLLWGITGQRPASPATQPDTISAVSPGPPALRRLARLTKRWELWLAVVALAATLAAWFWPRPWTGDRRPELYAVRLQVLDPRGSPVTGATVRASAGNEPHLLPDGWWEIQVPAAKVPRDGHLSIWAAHPEWQTRRVDLQLGGDPNLSTDLSLRPLETWLRGRVFDPKGQGVPGVRVSPADGTADEVRSTVGGRFALKLAVPAERLVALRAEHPLWAPANNVFCYAGRDSCTIVLGPR